MATLTRDVVISLAPDPASFKAGDGLASARHWVSRGLDEELIWGECQGSGAKPYQVLVDRLDHTSRCSCPSRKFPCKHALGLLLLVAGGQVPSADAPAWGREWLDGRRARAEKKAERAQDAAQTPAVSEEVVAARRERRASRITDSAAELSLWLRDLVDGGLAGVPARGMKPFDAQARRLVDGQAPGLARLVEELGAIAVSGEGWLTPFASRLGLLHLALVGLGRLDALPDEDQASLLAVAGVPVSDAELALKPALRDLWQVVSREVTLEDRLRVQRTWLCGRETGRRALILDFAFGSAALPTTFIEGTEVLAPLVFVAGSDLRAALAPGVNPATLSPRPLTALAGHESIGAALRHDAASRAVYPWLRGAPLCLTAATIQTDGRTWRVRDSQGSALELTPGTDACWRTFIATEGQPAGLVLDYEPGSTRPIAAMTPAGLVQFVRAPGAAEPPWTTSTGSPTAGEMPFLGALAGKALLGAVAFSGREVPAELQTALPKGDSPADATLNALGAVAAWVRCGAETRQPLAVPAPPQGAITPRENPGVTTLLERTLALLDTPNYRASGPAGRLLLEHWCELAARHGLGIPKRLLPDVLHAASSGKTPETLVPLLDPFTRHVASLHPTFARTLVAMRPLPPGATRESCLATWETGTAEQRLALLTALRQAPTEVGPDALSWSREFVRSTWSEEAAETRAAQVEVFGVGLSELDEPLLEAALDDRSVRVRRAAASLLVRLPRSAFAGRMTARLTPLVTFRPAVSGALFPPRLPKAATLDVALLAAFGNPGTAADWIRDGLVEKPPAGRDGASPLGQKQWWLHQLVALTPPSFWTDLTGLDAASVLTTLRATAGDFAANVNSALFEAAAATGDPEWSTALLLSGERPATDTLAALLAATRPDARPALCDRWFTSDRSDSWQERQRHAALLSHVLATWSAEDPAVAQRLALSMHVADLVELRAADHLHASAMSTLVRRFEAASGDPALAPGIGAQMAYVALRADLATALASAPPLRTAPAGARDSA